MKLIDNLTLGYCIFVSNMCTDGEKCIADLLQDLLITDDAQNKTKYLTCYTPYLVIKGQFSSSILWHKHFLSHLHIWCVKYTFLKYTRNQGTRWQDTNKRRAISRFMQTDSLFANHHIHTHIHTLPKLETYAAENVIV